MTHEPTTARSYSDIIQQVKEIVTDSDLDTLLNQILAMIMRILQSNDALLYLYDPSNDSLILTATRGDIANTHTAGTVTPRNQSIIGYTLETEYPIFTTSATSDPRWQSSSAPDNTHSPPASGCACLPFVVGKVKVGVVQIFNPNLGPGDPEQHLEFLHVLSMLLAPHIDKARQLADSQRRERRFKNLISIMSYLSTMLERDRLLDDIMTYVQDLLEVEATSIWIKDEQSGDLVLYVATGARSHQLREVRVPAGQGIIGNVTTTGEPVVVNDVRKDEHFYGQIDRQTGFTTRAIMCVPLKAPRIQLGGKRGELKATIIGGAQALNKRNGRPFTDEDTLLFQMLAGQAATILQLSELYNELSRLNTELEESYTETRKMFRGFINGITSFIDRKDPYTRGHSHRVSDFAVAIAEEMNLPEEMFDHIRIGGILHDVGKIGVPDAVLKKPGRLTDEEMMHMRLHPIYGIELLEDSGLLRLLPIERQAIEEHHERIDGSGYPRGLKGTCDVVGNLAEMAKHKTGEADETRETSERESKKSGISLIGRIVAVADAFDAMASNRPYRAAMSAEAAIAILRDAAGSEFDAACVEALVRAREKGKIQVQNERKDELLTRRIYCIDHSTVVS